MTVDCSGGQKFESRGLEAPFGNACLGLTRMAMGCPTVWKFHPPPNMAKMAGVGGTPNHRLLWRVWYVFWALLAGDAAQKKESMDLLLLFMRQQFTTEGQMWAESTNTSHYQIWLLGHACMRYLARHHLALAKAAGVAPPAGLEELLELTGKWWRRELFCYKLLAREGHVFSPGSRTSINNNELRTVVFAMLMGVPAPPRLKSTRPITGRPNDPNGLFWSNTYNAGAWVLRALMRAGDDVGGAAGPTHDTEVCLLRNRMLCYSKGDDFVFHYPHFTRASNALWWTARINGQHVDAPYDSGEIRNRDCPFPLPVEIDNTWTLDVIPGVHDDEAVSRTVTHDDDE